MTPFDELRTLVSMCREGDHPFAVRDHAGKLTAIQIPIDTLNRLAHANLETKHGTAVAVLEELLTRLRDPIAGPVVYALIHVDQEGEMTITHALDGPKNIVQRLRDGIPYFSGRMIERIKKELKNDK